jgi:hypothetical protein
MNEGVINKKSRSTESLTNAWPDEKSNWSKHMKATGVVTGGPLPSLLPTSRRLARLLALVLFPLCPRNKNERGRHELDPG